MKILINVQLTADQLELLRAALRCQIKSTYQAHVVDDVLLRQRAEEIRLECNRLSAMLTTALAIAPDTEPNPLRENDRIRAERWSAG